MSTKDKVNYVGKKITLKIKGQDSEIHVESKVRQQFNYNRGKVLRVGIDEYLYDIRSMKPKELIGYEVLFIEDISINDINISGNEFVYKFRNDSTMLGVLDILIHEKENNSVIASVVAGDKPTYQLVHQMMMS